MTDDDQLQRFIFEHSDIRSEIITLQDSYKAVLDNGSYPPPIQRLLGEMLAAAGLLSATLKFDGIITLQARGDGPVSLIMADCTRHHNLRGIAQYDENLGFPENASFRELIGQGNLTLTIDPQKGERYQGIVSLEFDTLAQCLEDYFLRSEQLPTRLWLSADTQRAGGLFLQSLPRQLEASKESNQQLWEHVSQLAATLSAEEQLILSHQEQLYRLFHEDELRLFEPSNIQFSCSCSKDRTARALKSLGSKELDNILAENGVIAIDCQFCHQQYRFTKEDINSIFNEEPPVTH